jgi:rhomboid protease GluP
MIDRSIGDPYAQSFEHLSQLDVNPALPSAAALDKLRHYAGLRRDASRSLAEGLRHNDVKKIREAQALEQKSRESLNLQEKTPATASP